MGTQAISISSNIGALAFSDYRGLAQMSEEDREGEGLVPGDLFYGVAGVDFYSDLTDTLEQVGRFRRAQPGEAVQGDGDRRRYYVFNYDWRKSNVQTAVKLHELIEQVRRDYGDPKLKVDIVAHSLGVPLAREWMRQEDAYRSVRRFVVQGTEVAIARLNGTAYAVHNLRVGFRADSGWDVYGWVRNAFDVNYYELLQVAPSNVGLIAGQPGDPRTFGGTIKFEF